MHLMLSRHGIWYYRKSYSLASGKRKEIRKSLGTRSKREAKILAAKLFSLSHSAEIGQIATNIITQDKIPSLEICISNYLRENSHLWQERHKFRIEGILKQLPKLHLERADVSKLKNKWLRTKSIATVNKCLGYCSMFYKWLQAEYDGIENLFGKVKLKGHVEKSRKAYTKDELVKFYNLAIQLREKGMESHFWFLMIGRYTGMRANEVCQLKPSDVDLDLNVFYVRGEVLKTKTSNRVIPIHPRLLELGLCKFLDTRSERLMEHWKASKRSFAAMPTKWYSNFRNRNGLPDYHSLRHTVATEMKSSGVPAQFSAAILGHINGNITFDRYGHSIAIEKLSEAINCLD
ncbi:site-specific integrase [Aliikangiella coralliicola]|uniref:Site-specific integrase n=1 Tax=Aliikangiella coralliicola TaxID=2592383 RepID=A0A545UD22_9GAMM|nr:site-specific integrase [Aliikangiella coralliicola]TQV87358.1 site-specific integrase [Aliikangiella coralliicola]